MNALALLVALVAIMFMLIGHVRAEPRGYPLYGCISATRESTHCMARQPDGSWFREPLPSQCLPGDNF